MNEQIKQIAARLAGLRDALEITVEEMANVCNLSAEDYLILSIGGSIIIPFSFGDAPTYPLTFRKR